MVFSSKNIEVVEEYCVLWIYNHDFAHYAFQNYDFHTVLYCSYKGLARKVDLLFLLLHQVLYCSYKGLALFYKQSNSTVSNFCFILFL